MVFKFDRRNQARSVESDELLVFHPKRRAFGEGTYDWLCQTGSKPSSIALDDNHVR